MINKCTQINTGTHFQIKGCAPHLTSKKSTKAIQIRSDALSTIVWLLHYIIRVKSFCYGQLIQWTIFLQLAVQQMLCCNLRLVVAHITISEHNKFSCCRKMLFLIFATWKFAVEVVIWATTYHNLQCNIYCTLSCKKMLPYYLAFTQISQEDAIKLTTLTGIHSSMLECLAFICHYAGASYLCKENMGFLSQNCLEISDFSIQKVLCKMYPDCEFLVSKP